MNGHFRIIKHHKTGTREIYPKIYYSYLKARTAKEELSKEALHQYSHFSIEAKMTKQWFTLA